MSQHDDDDLELQLQKAEAARAKSAREWQRLDATLFNPDLPQGKKLYLLGHLRTAHSESGLMYGSAARLARAMSVQPQAAERMQRTLRTEKVLELVDVKVGKTNTVKIAPAWMASVEQHYLEWKRGGPPPPKEGVSLAPPTPALEGGGTPALEGGGPPPPKEGNPFIDPANLSGSEGQPTVAPAIPLPPVHMADTSKSESCGVGSELHKQDVSQKVDQKTDKNTEIEGFNGQTWGWVSRLCKLDAISMRSFERFRVRNRMAQVSAVTSPAAVQSAIVDLEAAAAAKTLAGSASGALLGWARRAEHRPVASNSGQPGAFQGRPRMFVP